MKSNSINHFNLGEIKLDPRVPLFVLLVFFALVLMLNPAFGKSYYHLGLIFSIVTFSDFFLNYIFNKKIHFSLSPMASSIGIVLLVYSVSWKYFILISLMVSLSKFFIKEKGLHIYNPNNFGIVFGLIFFSDHVTTTIGRWNFNQEMFITMIVFGFLISLLANRALVSIAYFLSFTLFSLMRSFFLGTTISYELLPLNSPTFYLFMFYHITDPGTGPVNKKGMILFAVLIALVESVLRSMEVIYSPFFSYFIVLSFQPFLSSIFERRYRNQLRPA